MKHLFAWHTLFLLVMAGAPTQSATPVGDTIWLYSEYTASYVTADASDGYRLEAKGTLAVGEAEKFIVEDAGGGSILLKAVVNNHYCMVHTNDVDKLYADTMSTTDTLAHFAWTDLPGGKVRLTSVGDADGTANVSPGGASEVLRSNTSGAGPETEFIWGRVGAIGNLSAMVDDEWVALDWDDQTAGQLDFYRVYRSTERGTNYIEIASDLTASEYIDSGMPGGVAYYYVVTAVTDGMESPYSNEIVAVPNEVVKLQHLDGTVTGSVVAVSGVVTRWVDRTTSGNDAMPASGTVLYPSAGLLKSGLPGVDMQSGRNSLELFSAAGSDSWLDQSSRTNGFCVMVALKCDAVRTSDNNDVIGNSPDGSSGFGMGFTGAGEIQAWLGGQVFPSAGPWGVEDGETLVLALNYDAVAGTWEFWDSKNHVSAAGGLARADFSLGVPVTVGAAASPSRYLDGLVGEVKVFGSRLSPANFKRQRDQLMQKWLKRPNIVMVYVDDWAWYGSSVAMDERMPNSQLPDILEMPNLDLMAANGMVFRNAYGSPQCSPGRAALQTGQSNPRNGFTVYMNGDGSDYYDPKAGQVGDPYYAFPVIPNGSEATLRGNAVSIAEALAPMGYQSALFGKWHLRDDPNNEGYYAPDGNTDNNPGNTISGTLLDGIADPKLMTHITDSGIAFMEEKVAEGVPFYVQFSHYAMHEGRECFPASRARYQNHPDVVAYNDGKTNPAAINRKSDPAVWLGMAYELDQKIGEVRQKLVDLGIADNTYVIVVGDNGYRQDFFDEVYHLAQPLHAHKWWLWQGGIRVPMVVEGPGVVSNARCTVNVVNYDFLPTFVDWAGGDPGQLQDLDGISLAGLMAGEAPDEAFRNRSLYFHYPHYRTTMPHSVVIKGSDKLVYFYETPVRFPSWEPVMLFDLNNDAGEYHNTYLENPARGDSLYADMTNYLVSVGARIPLVPNPNYDAAIYQAANDGKDYAYRLLRGPFVGTRTPEEDEGIGHTTFLDYWMTSWGDHNLGPKTNDYDRDGIANWVEYTMDSNPTVQVSTGTVPEMGVSGGTLTYRYVKRNDDSSLTYTVESTTNLASEIWTTAGGREDVKASAGVLDEVLHSIPMDEPQSFVRLKTTNQ